MKKITAIILMLITLVMIINPTDIKAKDDSSLDGDVVGVGVTNLDFGIRSKKEIVLIWDDATDPYVKKYTVYRRNTVNSVGTGNWVAIGTVNSDGTATGAANVYVDKLKSNANQQYEYTVGVTVSNASLYAPANGATIIASNVKVCIDPGHFVNKNLVPGNTPYCEGNFTLLIGVNLATELRKYGILSSMTRCTGDILLGGYLDEELDSKHIKLRGEYAAVEHCDLFVSLHTNSNQENAHGYPTFSQPTSINHPLVIINKPAINNQVAINVANSIGYNLINENRRNNISTITTYTPASVGVVPNWDENINDSLNASGMTVCRLNAKGVDYYGVLKGSSNVGVPGMIIEHGFHSVPEMRVAAAGGNLDEAWAKADAYGIAFGFGFVNDIVYK